MICPICSAPFTPRDFRQQCCSKACGIVRYTQSDARKQEWRDQYQKHKKEIRKRRNERYASDPAYREKFVQYMRGRRQSNPEHLRKINAKNRDHPDRRASAAAISRQWHAENRKHANEGRIVRKQKMRISQPWIVLINGARARAKKKGLLFGLTSEWGEQRWTGRCELTDIPFTLGLRGVGAKLFSPSIDKIDPKKGYTQENCRIILWCVNAFKYDGTDEQMFFVTRALMQKAPKLTTESEPQQAKQITAE